jgi:hypothetical protein
LDTALVGLVTAFLVPAAGCSSFILPLTGFGEWKLSLVALRGDFLDSKFAFNLLPTLYSIFLSSLSTLGFSVFIQ